MPRIWLPSPGWEGPGVESRPGQHLVNQAVGVGLIGA